MRINVKEITHKTLEKNMSITKFKNRRSYRFLLEWRVKLQPRDPNQPKIEFSKTLSDYHTYIDTFEYEDYKDILKGLYFGIGFLP